MWETVSGIIISVGGAGAIIAAVVKFSASRLAERISDKYKHELSAQMERLKADLLNRNHSFQAKFDKEFEIYGKLMPAMLELTEKTFWLFPQAFDYAPQDEKERKQFYKKRYEGVFEALKRTQQALGEYAVFMPEHIYNRVFDVFRLCQTQYNLYPHFGDIANRESSSFKVSDKCFERTNEITSKYDGLIKELREHIANQLR